MFKAFQTPLPLGSVLFVNRRVRGDYHHMGSNHSNHVTVIFYLLRFVLFPRIAEIFETIVTAEEPVGCIALSARK